MSFGTLLGIGFLVGLFLGIVLILNFPQGPRVR
jgi:hypothetical protein